MNINLPSKLNEICVQNTFIQQSFILQLSFFLSVLSFFIIKLLLGTFFRQLFNIYFPFSICVSRFKEFWGVIQYPLIKNQVGIKIVKKKHQQQQLMLFPFEPLLSLYTTDNKKNLNHQQQELILLFFVPRDVFISLNRRLYYFKHYPHCCYSLYVKFRSKQNMFQGICMFLCLFDGVSFKPFENK